MPVKSDQSQHKTEFHARLFIAGDSPNSLIAKSNLERIKRCVGNNCSVEIVDVLENPRAALEHSIFVTPALQIIKPEPGALVYGNLSNDNALRSLIPMSK